MILNQQFFQLENLKAIILTFVSSLTKVITLFNSDLPQTLTVLVKPLML